MLFFFGSDPLLMEKLHWRGNCEALWHTDDLLGCAEIIVKSRGRHPTSSPSVSVNYTRCYLWDEHYLLLIGSRAFPGLWWECSAGRNAALGRRSNPWLQESATRCVRGHCVRGHCVSPCADAAQAPRVLTALMFSLHCCSTLHGFVVRFCFFVRN